MLRLEQANAIIEHALKHAVDQGVKPLTVVVLDESGYVVAAQRQDGATMFRFDVARAKAWGSAAFGVSSRALAGRAKENPNFFLSLAATAEGRFLPQQGGVVIRDSAGTILGAAGASGGTGDEDEACCVYGVEQAGLTAVV